LVKEHGGRVAQDASNITASQGKVKKKEENDWSYCIGENAKRMHEKLKVKGRHTRLKRGESLKGGSERR